MTEYADLTKCSYFSFECEALLAVGWLSANSQYETGDSDPAFFARLLELARSPWEPGVCMGYHECELCQFQPAMGKSNIFVPYQGSIYVAPELIVHYIAAHRYKPPQVFVDAVMTCPEMNSMDYKKALLANGGRSLVSKRNA
ncbi:MAG: hypothetical protein JXM79_07870 [Sedimentisphaerales bacterium]|nr:hypothetical protein [Sedimentisphaerales bacterium]